MTTAINTRIPRPVYAVAGIGELAVAQLRRLSTVKLSTVDLRGEIESLRAEAPARLAELPGIVKAVRSDLPGTVTVLVTGAIDAYAGLVARGERVVEERLGGAAPTAETPAETPAASPAEEPVNAPVAPASKTSAAVKAPRARKATNTVAAAINKPATPAKKAVKKAARKAA